MSEEELPRRRLRRREEEEEEKDKVDKVDKEDKMVEDKVEEDKEEEVRTSRWAKEKKSEEKIRESRRREKTERQEGPHSKKREEMVSPKSGESDLKSKKSLPKIQATENNDFDLDGSLFEKDSLLKTPEEEAAAEKMEVDPKLEAMEIETKMDVDNEVGKEEEKWAKGEKILCFHGPLIYEAKIQEVEVQNSIPK